MAAGLTVPEVAAALHKTTGAVKALQHRGLARLAVVVGLRSSDLDDAAGRLRRPQPPHHARPHPWPAGRPGAPAQLSVLIHARGRKIHLGGLRLQAARRRRRR
jgi:hypothetical protein